MVSPSIIFFDEFDSISKLRGSMGGDSTERVVNQLLTELDGVEELENVMIIAATNRQDLIDPALLRPGRIDTIIQLEVPDEIARAKIFEVHTKKMPIDKSVKLKDYVKMTKDWNGAEIESICRNAGINAIKRIYLLKKKQDLTITKQDFDNAIEEVSNSIGKEIIKISKKIEKKKLSKSKKI